MKLIVVGSMSHYLKFEKIKNELEDKGHDVKIPLSDNFYEKNNQVKKDSMIDFNKNLEECDGILVVNFDKNGQKNYIGINSIMEIGMAFNKNKKIFILNNVPENCREELEAIEVIELNGDLNNLK